MRQPTREIRLFGNGRESKAHKNRTVVVITTTINDVTISNDRTRVICVIASYGIVNRSCA